jgi:phosphoribosylformylglycinamidine synthase
MFEGGNALSDFRARQLLPKLQKIHRAAHRGHLGARFVHLVVTDALARRQRARTVGRHC